MERDRVRTESMDRNRDEDDREGRAETSCPPVEVPERDDARSG